MITTKKPGPPVPPRPSASSIVKSQSSSSVPLPGRTVIYKSPSYNKTTKYHDEDQVYNMIGNNNHALPHKVTTTTAIPTRTTTAHSTNNNGFTLHDDDICSSNRTEIIIASNNAISVSNVSNANSKNESNVILDSGIDNENLLHEHERKNSIDNNGNVWENSHKLEIIQKSPVARPRQNAPSRKLVKSNNENVNEMVSMSQVIVLGENDQINKNIDDLNYNTDEPIEIKNEPVIALNERNFVDKLKINSSLETKNNHKNLSSYCTVVEKLFTEIAINSNVEKIQSGQSKLEHCIKVRTPSPTNAINRQSNSSKITKLSLQSDDIGDNIEDKVAVEKKVTFHEQLISELTEMHKDDKPRTRYSSSCSTDSSPNGTHRSRIRTADWVEVGDNGKEVLLSSCQISLEDSGMEDEERLDDISSGVGDSWDSVKDGVDESYTELVTITRTSMNPISYTRNCGIFKTKVCYDYRNHIESHTVDDYVKRTRLTKKCCNGYLSLNDKCIPVCSTKCINAKCTFPNTCTCNPGYEPPSLETQMENIKNFTCIPKCDGCNSGSCTGPNQCSCYEGYRYNEASKTCDPICSTPCFNANCTEPEVCTCWSDYHKNISGACIENECKPTSTKNDCLNGTCTSNGICLCNDGYAKNGSTNVCQPLCIGCDNGTCVSPNKCICNTGFDWNASESKCVPKTCQNGIWKSPDICVCHEGYKQSNSSTCSPICDPTCVAGTCVLPNKCTCLEGYQLINGSNYFCSPICASDCLNGICIEPHVCLCKIGFTFNETSKQCTPICDEECVNSECTLPNICTCKAGLVKVNATHCKVRCENCANGFCDVANVCQCDIDFHMNDDGKCVQNECTPNLIKDSCENGYCANDGICICNSGYSKNTSSVCAPICSSKCINGICTEPDVCLCKTGFMFNKTSKQCTPICDKECVNSKCTSPNICTCQAGLVKVNATHCKVPCENCTNGYCKAANVCQCDIDFHMNDDGKCVQNECTPNLIKDSCENGYCANDGICICNSGYAKTTSSMCAPICSSKCINGICIEPDVCLCKTGFMFNKTFKQCSPICDEECVNSECTLPNVCTCQAGLIKVNATHCEVPCENCTNGYCKTANVCQCDIDFHMNDDGKCVPNECTPNAIEDSCENGYCNEDGTCMCNSGYAKNTSMVCAPTCSSKCINGFCSHPDLCQCYGGYVLSTSNGSGDAYNCTNCTIPTNWNVCDPICYDCVYGKCKMPGVCYCSDGYTQHPKDSGKCILITDVDKNFLWIIVTLAVLGAVLCIIAVLTYRRYLMKISYNVNSDVCVYENWNSDNEL